MKPVPKLWSGDTAVCLGSGPSLCREDVEAVRGRARVIAVNTSWQMAPWANVLYAADWPWWQHYRGVPEFQGMKYSIQQLEWRREGLRKVGPQSRYGVTVLDNTGVKGLERDPSGLRTGMNSGYQAINLAVHFGVSRIVLLGYDMRGGHWHGPHPEGVRRHAQVESYQPMFPFLVQPLRELGVAIVNCSRETALTCFERRPLSDLFPVAACA